ncbi:hypothetical protein CTZ24_24425 (plasmid) [Pantoea phytobeneficialis]|uniref:Colicin transporter n=1 Tax=Pantoea phytobeneficialis TaxID=2052056 RepID=A0AAP9HA85_9GAMM|nr:hypothetical protein CTZ24_24425 [Pantoea phytobeneficialis]
MTGKYYFRHCFWGLIGFGYFVYSILKDLHDGLIFPAYIPYIPYVAIYLSISAVTYPYSLFVTNKLGLMIMKKETWSYFFTVNGPSWNFFIFVYLFCGLLSVPLLILYPLIKRSV